MTDLTPHEAPVTTSPAAQVDPTGGRLEAWARALHAAHQIGTALCGTAFAPTHFKGKPDDAAAAVMFGEGWTNDIRAMVVSSIISLVLGSITGFFLGKIFKDILFQLA